MSSEERRGGVIPPTRMSSHGCVLHAFACMTFLCLCNAWTWMNSACFGCREVTQGSDWQGQRWRGQRWLGRNQAGKSRHTSLFPVRFSFISVYFCWSLATLFSLTSPAAVSLSCALLFLFAGFPCILHSLLFPPSPSFSPVVWHFSALHSSCVCVCVSQKGVTGTSSRVCVSQCVCEFLNSL